MSPATMSDLVGQVEAWVQLYLNDHDVKMIQHLFAPSFVDHDPIPLPTAQHVHTPAARTTSGYLDAVVAFLGSPGVDIQFTLEDVFAASDRVAYRLFGEGNILLRSSALAIGASSLPPLADQVHVTYQTTGIFRVADRRFAERWGPIVVC